MSAPVRERSGGIGYWLHQRKPAFIVARLGKLLSRYGVTPHKAKRRTFRLIGLLARHDVRPTLATPGRVVGKHPAFMRDLRDAGVELAIHGFDHLDFRSLTQADAHRQFALAAAAYSGAGIPFTGFRCPYLSFSHDMTALVPDGLVDYSSNEAVWWDVVADGNGGDRGVVFENIADFYRATPAGESLVLPRVAGRFVEIPVSLPDDLQLLDGLKAGDDGVREAWVKLLEQSHEQGSVFVVLFHPESFDLCAGALEGLLVAARALDPPVWVTRLGDVATWWRELGTFSATVDGSTVELACTDRATVLARGAGLPDGREWRNGYRMLDTRSVPLVDGARPFVGAHTGVSDSKVARLRELGYIVEHGEAASSCTIQLGSDDVARCRTDRDLVELVEAQSGSLMRFWQWPDGAGSSLCITGDLDALSLADYAFRVFVLIGRTVRLGHRRS